MEVVDIHAWCQVVNARAELFHTWIIIQIPISNIRTYQPGHSIWGVLIPIVAISPSKLCRRLKDSTTRPNHSYRERGSVLCQVFVLLCIISRDMLVPGLSALWLISIRMFTWIVKISFWTYIRGNWSVDLQAGSSFGYRPMLFVILLTGVGAILFQVSHILSCQDIVLIIFIGPCMQTRLRNWAW